ncbi:glycoside hydrolase family 15 protein [Pseudactinotalea sp. HY160]|uniref:glycoside hydrolase family 15 protein n=1 Tax=Pseudactinotalea sp. HY160 TaxID=2654490 RepID=UPI001883377E|nr:glycoside hydrolase family 15 protein [Pseudactinotalea sp. HY160]
MRRRLLAAVAALALLAGVAPQAVAASTYEVQPGHASENFALTGGRAGAVTIVTDAAVLETFGAWIASESSRGEVVASVRTDVTDPGTQIARARVDLGERGGTGAGWLEFDLGVALAPGHEYTIVLEARGTDGEVIWHGNRSRVPGAIPSWNYDLEHWGGWVQYGRGRAAHLTNWNLAFYVDDALSEHGCAGLNECWRHVPAAERHVYPAGLIGAPGRPHALTAYAATGASYVPGSSVLALPGGPWLYAPGEGGDPVVVAAGDPGALAQIEESRAWLASGSVPGRTPGDRELAERALLDLRLLLQESGAVAAAWRSAWKYSWPRDSAFVAVALARAGHLEEARRILAYQDATLRRDCTGRQANCLVGTWDARTRLDGSGPPDDRPWQLDANGFVPWAVWQYLQALPTSERAAAAAEFYDMVRLAADVAASSLSEAGLPPARPDYWETSYPAPNLGTAAPLLAGLRAAAAIAETTGRFADADRWFAAADRLAAGIEAAFGRIGYQRTIVEGSGSDSAIAWLAPPFNPADESMWEAIDATWRVLLEPTGGVTPGAQWPRSESWTPETMFFALAWAHGKTPERAAQLVDWLDSHRTAVGAFPEKVTAEGDPADAATLAWTAALTLLTLEALADPLPTPPAGPAREVTGDPAVEPAAGTAGEPGTAGGEGVADPADVADLAGAADVADAADAAGADAAGAVSPTGAGARETRPRAGVLLTGLVLGGLLLATAGTTLIRRRRPD